MAGEAISSTRLYGILSGMKTRCNNPNSQHYKWYGAKGIKVCDEWSGKGGAVRFVDWAMANGYRADLTIDRIDPKGDYCPENCRWISRSDNTARSSWAKKEFGEAYMFIEMRREEILDVRFRNHRMIIKLRDGTIHEFEEKPKKSAR